MIQAIKGNEGLQLTAYIAPEGLDKDGNWDGRGLTVGYGHLVKAGEDITEGDTITEEQAKGALGTTQVSQHEFDAMVDVACASGSISATTTPKLVQAIGK